jgi:hypothetical protein
VVLDGYARSWFIADSSVGGYDGGQDPRDEEQHVTAEPSPPSAPKFEDKSDEQSSSLPLWLIVLAVLILGGTVALIIYGYVEKPGWIGSSGKQFWDYLDLLIVPAALALGVYWLNRRETERQDQAQAEREREREADAAQRERERVATEEAQRKREQDVEKQRAQDAALQAYLDQMSRLLLDEGRPLRQSKEGEEVRTLARARTLTVLPTFDGERKVRVLQFLYESKLIAKGRAVLDLSGADLSGVDLRGVVLSKADLSGADLSKADLRRASVHFRYSTPNQTAYSNVPSLPADLSETNLSGADLRGVNRSDKEVPGTAGTNLSGADLSFAKLFFANLSRADLSGANLLRADLNAADLRAANLRKAQGWTEEQLKEAKSLEGATMPNGQKYEDWLKSKDREEDK